MLQMTINSTVQTRHEQTHARISWSLCYSLACRSCGTEVMQLGERHLRFDMTSDSVLNQISEKPFLRRPQEFVAKVVAAPKQLLHRQLLINSSYRMSSWSMFTFSLSKTHELQQRRWKLSCSSISYISSQQKINTVWRKSIVKKKNSSSPACSACYFLGETRLPTGTCNRENSHSIVCEATGRAEEMGGFLVKGWREKKKKRTKSGRERGRGRVKDSTWRQGVCCLRAMCLGQACEWLFTSLYDSCWRRPALHTHLHSHTH